MGGGSESSSNYSDSEVLKFLFWISACLNMASLFILSIDVSLIVLQIVFFGIDNIHAMRESLIRLRDYLDTHGATSSDGMSSFLVFKEILYRVLH